MGVAVQVQGEAAIITGKYHHDSSTTNRTKALNILLRPTKVQLELYTLYSVLVVSVESINCHSNFEAKSLFDMGIDQLAGWLHNNHNEKMLYIWKQSILAFT